MKRKWKVTIALVVVLALGIGGFAGYRYSRRDIVTVQTAKVIRQNLTSIVTASGEIKPRTYINVGANAPGASRIISIEVVEGQAVREGQLLARLESVQPEADVAAQRAAVATTEADSAAAEASLQAAAENIRVAEASVERAKADLEKSRLTYVRTQQLWEAKLIAKQEYDQRQLEMQALEAALREAELRIDQLKAQRAQTAASMSASQRRVTQAQAQLKRVEDVLDRTYVVSPIDGVVTNLPVRIGETVVPGIQNSAASLIMTIADMSLITSEVMVDETDIVNVDLGQPVEITIDAMPGQTFHGSVIEIGNTAILRSTGLAASQSAVSSQEAKDFKVVVALSDPPAVVRPGLSSTAKIETAVKTSVLSIPIQALTVRTLEDLEPFEDDAQVQLTREEEEKRKEEIQGVFVVEGQQAVYREVESGITGTADIEVLSGLQEGDEIITGSYRAIRTLRNEARVKVDNRSSEGKDES